MTASIASYERPASQYGENPAREIKAVRSPFYQPFSTKMRTIIFHENVDDAHNYFGIAVAVITSVGLAIASFVDNVEDATRREWKHINTVLKGLPYLGLAACVDIPFTINGIIDDVEGLIDGNVSERWDSALLLIGKVGSIGESIACIAQSVGEIWEHTAPALSWAVPLSVAAGSLSIATVIYNVKGWVETKKYLSEFEKAAGLKKKPEKYTLEDYENALTYLLDKKSSHKSVLKQHFQMDEEKHLYRLCLAKSVVKNSLSQVNQQASLDPAQAIFLYKRMKALRSRVQAKIVSNQLGAVISVVSLTALGVGTFSPVPVAAIGIAGAACVLTIAKTIHDKVAAYRFNKALRIEDPVV